jgi:hypothetical protein
MAKVAHDPSDGWVLTTNDADWAESVRRSCELPPASSTALQDGMLQHFLGQPTDWKTKRKSEVEPFDYRAYLRKYP